MADTGGVDPALDAIAKRKQFWTKESLERRRAFLEKSGLDPENLAQMKGEELVHYCLVTEGLVAGKLPLKQIKAVDPMERMMQMMMDREEKLRQELKEERRIEREREERKEEARILRDEQKQEELRLREEKKEQEMGKRRQEEKEEKRLEKERYKHQLQTQLEIFERMQNARITQEGEARESRENSKENKTRLFGDLLKKVIRNMPHQVSELPVYFSEIDKTFTEFRVPNDIRVILLTPYLSLAARKILATLSSDQMADYALFKAALLKQLALTPNKYRDLFWFAEKKAGETYTIYASRLQSLLGYYLSSREATTLDEMKAIIIADKIKAGLPLSILNEVNNREALKFLSPHELGVVADHISNNEEVQQNAYKKNWGIDDGNPSVNRNGSFPFLRKQFRGRCFSCQSSEHYADNPICPNYMNDKADVGNFVQNSGDSANGVTHNRPTQNRQFDNKQNESRFGNNENRAGNNAVNNRNGVNGRPGWCTFCGKSGHVISNCFVKRRGDLCIHCGADNHASSNCRRKNHSVNRVQATFGTNELVQGGSASQERNGCDREKDDVIDVEKLLALSDEHERLSKEKLHVDFVQSSSAPSMGEPQNKVTIPTGVCDLKVGDRWVTCIVDSGTDITVLRQDAVDSKHMLEKAKTKVNLYPAFGRAVQADLINAPCCMKMDNGGHTSPVILKCAVTDELRNHSLLTLQDYANIIKGSELHGFTPHVARGTGSKEFETDKDWVKLESNAADGDGSLTSELHIDNVITVDIAGEVTGKNQWPMLDKEIPQEPSSVLQGDMTGVQTKHAYTTDSVKEHCKQVVHHSVELGGQVIVLFPDTNKPTSKFKDPAMVKENLRDYVFHTEMSDGVVRKLYVNKPRWCMSSAQTDGVTFEKVFGTSPCDPSPEDNSLGLHDVDWSKVDLGRQNLVKSTHIIRVVIIQYQNVFGKWSPDDAVSVSWGLRSPRARN